MSIEPAASIIVVGAAGGIGVEIVKRLAQRTTVIGIVQNGAQIAIALAAGAKQAIVCDITDSAAVQSALGELEEISAGRISGLVVCAAMQPVGAVETVSRSELERLFAVNVFGAMELVQGLLPALRRNHGRIVLFSSMAGRLSAPLLGAYSATKYALEALADALRRELRDSGVSVSLIEPGGVDTPMAAAQGSLAEQGLQRLSPELQKVYGPLYRGYRAMTAKALKYASTPAAVAAVACEAVIDSPAPKPRYLVGTDANLMVMTAKMLSTSMMDALLVKATVAK
jgi:NAD(P)-dependent dehydrogenase (short-subunit alcohol dehydrogenase family)